MEPLLVTQDFFDSLMELPDGSDVTDCFEQDDPQWRVTSITLYKTEHGHAVLSCNSILAVEPAPTEEEKS